MSKDLGMVHSGLEGACFRLDSKILSEA